MFSIQSTLELRLSRPNVHVDHCQVQTKLAKIEQIVHNFFCLTPPFLPRTRKEWLGFVTVSSAFVQVVIYVQRNDAQTHLTGMKWDTSRIFFPPPPRLLMLRSGQAGSGLSLLLIWIIFPHLQTRDRSSSITPPKNIACCVCFFWGGGRGEWVPQPSLFIVLPHPTPLPKLLWASFFLSMQGRLKRARHHQSWAE